MTQNNKPGTLPDAFDEQLQNAPEFAFLVADNRLARHHLIERIEDRSGVSVRCEKLDQISIKGLARLLRHYTDEEASVRWLSNHHRWSNLAQDVADTLGLPLNVETGRNSFTKAQLIYVWFGTHPAWDGDKTADPIEKTQSTSIPDVPKPGAGV